MPKTSEFFKSIPDEIWFSAKVQKDLKELDDAEYRWTSVEEIQPDELTKAMIAAFKDVLQVRDDKAEVKSEEIPKLWL